MASVGTGVSSKVWSELGRWPRAGYELISRRSDWRPLLRQNWSSSSGRGGRRGREPLCHRRSRTCPARPRGATSHLPPGPRAPDNHVSVKLMGKKSRKPKKAAAVAERPQVLETDAVPSSLPSPATSKICVVCGQEGLKKCESCRSTRYCGTDCQTRHWPRHKDFCAAAVDVGKAKASLATGKRNATDYANLCVEAASAINTGDCSASTTADFRIKAIYNHFAHAKANRARLLKSCTTIEASSSSSSSSSFSSSSSYPARAVPF